MGAYKIDVTMHDDQAEDFVRWTLGADWASLGAAEMGIIQATARYIAQRLLDASPELAEIVGDVGDPWDAPPARSDTPEPSSHPIE